MSKTVVITGASRGIGRAIAICFAKSGYDILINYNKNKEKAMALLDEIKGYGVKSLAFRADISNGDDVIRMHSFVKENFGMADVLINNAGIAEQALFTDISEEMWDRMFNINIKGAYLCTKAFLPDMINQKHGRVINISSMWGISGASCEVHYSASKAALIGFTKALAKEVGLSGITVNCIAPGVIDTDMNAMLDENAVAELKDCTPMNRIGTPYDIAETALFLASDKASFITGQIISVDGGFII